MSHFSLAAFKILLSFNVWMWCVLVWVSLSFSYLELSVLDVSIDISHLICKVCSHYFFRYFFCPLFSLSSHFEIPVIYVCLPACKFSTSPLDFLHFSLFFIHFVSRLDNHISLVFKFDYSFFYQLISTIEPQ